MKHQLKTVVMLLLLLFIMGYNLSSKELTLVLDGVIEDSQCAFNVHSKGHSHEMMIKSGVGGSSEKACTLHCVKQMGGDYVLVVKGVVYRLDDQDQPEKFAGEKVKLTGTLLDAKTNTLHVTSIERER